MADSDTKSTESTTELWPLLQDKQSFREYKNAELLFNMETWLPGFFKRKVFLIIYFLLPFADIILDYWNACKFI